MRKTQFKKTLLVLALGAATALPSVLWAHEAAEAPEAGGAHSEPAAHPEPTPHGPYTAHTAHASAEGEHGESALNKGKTYLVRPGDSLDRIIQKTMPNNPLKIDILRQAMVAANPQTFVYRGNYRLRAGQMLQLPDWSEVVRQAVAPVLQGADLESQSARDDQARRRWVHYP